MCVYFRGDIGMYCWAMPRPWMLAEDNVCAFVPVTNMVVAGA